MPSQEDWNDGQRKTFTKWVNKHLKVANRQIANLANDFEDGEVMASLVEVLCNTSLAKSTKKVGKGVHFNNMERITLAFTYLKKKEKLDLKNIDPGHLLNHNEKLIMGMVWQMILHFSIAKKGWKGEKLSVKEVTEEQRLLLWIQMKVPDLKITNFTKDWNDGRAICALVDACGPGLCPDWKEWTDKKQFTVYIEFAMKRAEEDLGVERLIDVSEMASASVKKESMIAYLSQFPSCSLRPGAKLAPKVNAARVQVLGSGLDRDGITVNSIARFRLDTYSAGQATPEVKITNSQGKEEKCTIVKNNKDGTYTCTYTPLVEGKFTIVVLYGGQPIPNSPFTVNVKGKAGEVSKVTAAGDCIQKHSANCRERISFDVNTGSGNEGKVDVDIVDHLGYTNTVIPNVTKAKGGAYQVQFKPIEEGTLVLEIYFNGKQIPNSPFKVEVKEPSAPLTPELGVEEETFFATTSSSQQQAGGTAKSSSTSKTGGGQKKTLVKQGSSRTSSVSEDYEDSGRGTSRTSSFSEEYEESRQGGTVKISSTSKTGGGQKKTLVKQGSSRTSSFSEDYEESGRAGSMEKGSAVGFSSSITTVSSTATSIKLGSLSEVLEKVLYMTSGDVSAYSFFAISPSGKEVSIKLVQNEPMNLEVNEQGVYTFILKKQNMEVGRYIAEITGEPNTKTVHEFSTSRTVRSVTLERSTGSIEISGEGYMKGVCAKDNTFTVTVPGDAGLEMFTIGMMGPKVAVDELKVKYVGNNKFNITYRVTKKGQYIIAMTWGNQEIPGSPFTVQVS